MGSWSTSEPSLPEGVSWSDAVTSGASGTGNDNFYFRVRAAIARGAGSTIYVRCELRIRKKSGGNPAAKIILGADVSVGGGTAESSDTAYCGDWSGTGEYATRATYYYTGTASPGTTVAFRCFQHDNVTTWGYLSAPAYVTCYAVTYDGNGADSGATESQSKLYNDSVTIRECGFIKEHFDFLEWNTAADGTGTRYMPGASYATNAALALYAIWEKATMPVYVSDKDGIYESDAVYVNADGEICECAVYVNIDGEIKEIV